jgi:hypothetical protein
MTVTLINQAEQDIVFIWQKTHLQVNLIKLAEQMSQKSFVSTILKSVMAWSLFLSQPIQEEIAHEKSPLVHVKEADGKKSTIKTVIKGPWA